MRWTSNEPEYDEEREHRFFAWLPVNCQNEWRWMETVVVLQFYRAGEWVNSKFLN
jgi:hypothetical protein